MQPRTLLPQFSEVTDEPSIQDVNIEEDPYNFVYDGIPRDHRVLKERSPCSHCEAKLFGFEFAIFCYMTGQTMLAHSEIPEVLYSLFTSQDETGKLFRNNIRAYNTKFSMASVGVTLDGTMNNMREGVYTFRAHKGIYHRIDPRY
ncbi:hypothetical protein QVD17_08949 [Tagetes erecta]|uniref:Uncharacterized protein n=1 Tax=Tagetes erecta TaxID=13708 RepID=A0AAD8NXW2_TARER|nr:hypothetical protein QVD17_08949 [Tagetes erecta]